MLDTTVRTALKDFEVKSSHGYQTIQIRRDHGQNVEFRCLKLKVSLNCRPNLMTMKKQMGEELAQEKFSEFSTQVEMDSRWSRPLF